MRRNHTLHWFDRYLGIPLIFFLGLLRRKRAFVEPVRIGVLNTAAIGDTILLSGAIGDLRERFPEATITFFAGPSNVAAAELIEGIEVIPIPAISPWKAIPKIRKQEFDLWIDFGQWPRLNALYSFFAKAKFKIGFETPGQFRHYVYDKSAKHEVIHELDNYRKLVALVGGKGKALPALKIKSDGGKGSKRLAFHLFAGGSRSYLKEWPEKKWIELAARLKGFEIVLTGAPADRLRCEAIQAQCGGQVLAGKLSLRETAEMLAGCRAVLSVDTGIMHLAATMGCPTVALHGPTSPFRWGGVGARVVAVSPKMGYCPCIHLGFESKCTKNTCMEAIEVDQVMKALGLLQVFVEDSRELEHIDGFFGSEHFGK